MYCVQCGTRNEEQYKFCVHCGAKLVQPIVPVPTAISGITNWKIGDKIEGRYEIYNIKKGGMGVVFLCYDHEERIPVAIKTLQDQFSTNKDDIDRFTWEAETWVRLEKHKNIVRAFYVKNISQRPYIFLEFVAGHKLYGSDLSGWIWMNGLDLELTLSFAIQFCLGMEHAEKKFKEMGRPFVHRDIKPSNIMITQDKTVKVTDLGLVKAFAGLKGDVVIGKNKDEVTGAERYGLSKVGSVCGTPPYMSPEQWLNSESVDTRSDIYSFGCVLYEMLTGQPPFICTTSDDFMSQHLKTKPGPPRKLASAVPKRLSLLTMKCLEKDPAKRHQDFRILREELSEIYLRQTGKRTKTDESPQELEESDYINKGYSLDNLGRPREAIVSYDMALQINPMSAVAWNDKGVALGNLGGQERAIDCYDKALEANPRYAEAWYNKGNSLNDIGRHEEATGCYDSALKLNPRLIDAWNNKGVALSNLAGELMR